MFASSSLITEIKKIRLLLLRHYVTWRQITAMWHHINPLAPNDFYRGRTAPLTSKVAFYIFIQQIQELNILNMVYTLRFFFFKMQFVS
jgi:hypothetical protein